MNLHHYFRNCCGFHQDIPATDYQGILLKLNQWNILFCIINFVQFHIVDIHMTQKPITKVVRKKNQHNSIPYSQTESMPFIAVCITQIKFTHFRIIEAWIFVPIIENS